MEIDGNLVTTLTANTLGSVTYQLDPTALTLAAGQHTITLHSLLLDESAKFRSR